MIREAFQYLFDKCEAHVHTVHELPYSDKGITLVAPPQAPVISVETLSAMVKLSRSDMQGMEPKEVFAQVHNHFNVHLSSIDADKFGRRRNLVTASISDSSPFQFGQFMEPERFVISLNSCFVEDAALKSLLSIASSLTAENTAIAEDDGISQTATVRQGISLKTSKKIEPKVKLRPYRTFREVEQPASMFLFRLRNQDGAPPNCALFEADGGAWKLEAVKNIAEFLEKSLAKGVSVVF